MVFKLLLFVYITTGGDHADPAADPCRARAVKIHPDFPLNDLSDAPNGHRLGGLNGLAT